MNECDDEEKEEKEEEEKRKSGKKGTFLYYRPANRRAGAFFKMICRWWCGKIDARFGWLGGFVV